MVHYPVFHLELALVDVHIDKDPYWDRDDIDKVNDAAEEDHTCDSCRLYRYLMVVVANADRVVVAAHHDVVVVVRTWIDHTDGDDDGVVVADDVEGALAAFEDDAVVDGA